ncbi:MAG: Flp family type IVb pilin [Firmicutes bacterium]|nr:Flp family type IVb pilin [Bacillota bacterium]
MVEYGLILALIAVAAIVALNTMSDGLDTILTKVSDTLTNAGN